jgi:hypothetical protein
MDGMRTYYVYMLRCFDGTFYTGMTNDIERRYNEHVCGYHESCYTFTRRPLCWCMRVSSIGPKLRLTSKSTSRAGVIRKSAHSPTETGRCSIVSLQAGARTMCLTIEVGAVPRLRSLRELRSA